MQVEDASPEAQFVLQMLGERDSWNQMTQRVAAYANKMFQEALLNAQAGALPSRRARHGSQPGKEVTIFELMSLMARDQPINQMTLSLMHSMTPQGFGQLDAN